jgi:hypothetical protein
MANNIRIIGNVNNTSRITRINDDDLNLLSPEVKNQYFGFENDYIELFVYDTSNNLLSTNYNYRSFKLPSNSGLTAENTLPIIEIDPVQDLQNLGYVSGEFSTQYHFQKRYLSNPDELELFISEISADRTEIRLNSTSITSDDLQVLAEKLIQDIEVSSDTKYYLFNLPDNRQFLVVNAAVDNESQTLLLKLYEPLSDNIQIKESGWMTEEIIEPYVFDINLDASVIPELPPQLRGPNFDIEVDVKQNVATKYENYNSLVSSLTGSSYHKVLNYMNDNSYDLNIDYTSFSNFIHFSSAKKRLEVFYSKIKQIEDYNTNISIINASTSVLKNEETSSIRLKIDNIVTNFDGFESYMYFESSSYAWPKTSTIRPYTLSTTSSANTWYSVYTSSAINYDDRNLDHLYNVIPEYIKSDPLNYQPYYDFVDMIGHYFDNIWIYIDSINELYNADNNLEKGVSKDIVYDALRSLGVKLYNSKGDNEFDNYIGGLNSGSTLFINDFSVTSSYLNNVPKKDQLAELYKRIYHNIPLLSKTKGTSAGLQNLITTFGVTSSIFTPKELGGSTRTGGLKGYDNDKITIQNNTITGSVLSPFISVQQPFTGSNDFTSTDLHFVDLSFSPQTALDLRVSSSIARSKPTFSLDDYIGDPRLMESSSYDVLNIQRQEYFINSGSITNRLDYKGFFELVKYFDNSLFKMLKDFVPARANALTGVTIKSPVLERNKIKTYRPKATEETVHDAVLNTPSISEDADYHYDKIEGNKSSFYTGELTGSYANINDVFESSNPNPYLIPTESIDVNKFNHSEFNVTLNNVAENRTSVSRVKIEDKYNSLLQIIGTLTSSVELQDSNESLLGHKRSRYDGTRLSSLKYNTYTTSSTTYTGDTSFGQSAVIDRNNVKFSTVKSVNSKNLNFRDKSNIKLKYLVTKDSDLNELNLENKKWFEVQNTFKAGENLIISLSDPSKDKSRFSGEKTIWQSGYSYDPIIYRESNETLYFEYTSSINNYNTRLGVKAYTTSSFRYEYVGNQIAIPPDQPSTPTTVLGQAGSQHEYKWYRNGATTFTAGSPMAAIRYTTGSWMHQAVPGLNATTNQMDLTGSAGTVSNITFNNRNYQLVYGFDLLDFANVDYNSEYNADTYQTLNSKYYLYKTQRSSTYVISGSVNFNLRGNDTGTGDQDGPSVFRAVCVVEKTTTPNDEYSWTHVAHTTLVPIANYQQQQPPFTSADDVLKYNKDQSTIWFDNDMAATAVFKLNVETTATISAGYYIRFRFYWVDLNGAFAPTPTSGGANDLNFSLDSNASFEIYDSITPKINYTTTGSIDQSASLFTLATTNVTNDTLVFNSTTFNQFLYKSYFIPNSVFSGSYTTPVDLISFNAQDLVRAGRFDDPGNKYYNVVTSSIISGEYKVVVDGSIDTTLMSGAQNFAIFRRKPDETSIYVNNSKDPGDLSDKMYIIPTDLSGSIKDDIGNILKKLDPNIIS